MPPLIQDLRLSQKEKEFGAMGEGVAKLLPQEVCLQHKACKELRGACQDLDRKWEELKRRVENMIDHLMRKVRLTRVH